MGSEQLGIVSTEAHGSSFASVDDHSPPRDASIEISSPYSTSDFVNEETGDDEGFGLPESALEEEVVRGGESVCLFVCDYCDRNLSDDCFGLIDTIGG
jgi:hypothetical protein